MIIHRIAGFVAQSKLKKVLFPLKTGGQTLEEAFEQVAIAMFGYMTNLETVSIQRQYDIEVEGLDMMSLLFQFLDEFLFAFSCEPNFIPRVRSSSVCSVHYIIY